MAFPVIKVDSTNGAKSDTACSGAGPTTAKTGTAASSTTTTNIDITDVVDLSGVATDGSAVIYFADTTAGHRRFARITGITGGPSGSTWHVALDANSPVTTTVGPFSWAIGGTRASLGSATSILLISNNSSTGDMRGGWTIQLQSGHTETLSSRLITAGSAMGDTTNGPVTIQGQPSAATLPNLIFSNTDQGFIQNVSGTSCWVLKNFELRTSSGTHSVGNYAVQINFGTVTLVGMKIGKNPAAAQTWLGGVNFAHGASFGPATVRDCEIAFCSSHGIVYSTACRGIAITNCYIHDNGGDGINDTVATSNQVASRIHGNVIYKNAAYGLNLNLGTNTDGLDFYDIVGNTIDSNTANDGIKIAGTSTSLVGVRVLNNICSNNGGYGVNFSGVADNALLAFNVQVQGNSTFNNTSGAYHSTTAGYTNSNCPWASGDTGANPTYTNAAGGDFSIGANLKAQGYPLGGTLPVGTLSSTYSYVDPGAAQRQEPVATTAVQSLILQPTGTY